MKKAALISSLYLLAVPVACQGQRIPVGASPSPCSEPLRIKGYYVVSFHATDVHRLQQRTALKRGREALFDMQTLETFIPEDSVTAQRSLTTNIADLFTCRNNIAYYVPDSNDIIKYYCQDSTLLQNGSGAPANRFALDDLVVSKNRTGEVYKIYYLEALWTTFQVPNSPAARRLVGSPAITRCVASPNKLFTVVCCLRVLSTRPYQVPENGEFIKY
jgi:hypothetical protein